MLHTGKKIKKSPVRYHHALTVAISFEIKKTSKISQCNHSSNVEQT